MKEGNITRINSEAVRLTGWKKENAHRSEFLFPYSKLMTRKEADSKNRQLDIVLLSGRTIKLSSNTMLIAKNNKEFPHIRLYWLQ